MRNTATVAFKGRQVEVDLNHCYTCGQLAKAVELQVEQPLAVHTLKLLVPKHGAVQLLQQPEQQLDQLGVHAGSRCILLGSYQTELQSLELAQQAANSLRLPGFQHEAQRAAARSSSTVAQQTGKHYFGSFQVLPVNPFAPPGAPPPSAALALLHQLAADPAIADVMQRHGWRVPLLSEMAPEGRVGVSEVCVLGFNVNRGTEISLRLRTDDYGGFRKYLSIRRTLVHELTHNVWSDHDINFKQLNSQLLREVEEFEARHGSARTLAGVGAAYDPAAAAAATALQPTPTAHTLAAAAAADGQQQQQLLHHALPASDLAAAAALARWQQQQQQVADTQVPVSAAAAGAPAPPAPPLQPGSAAPAAAAAAAEEGGVDDWRQYEHEDAATAAAEAAADRLGSLDEPPQETQETQEPAATEQASWQKQQQPSQPAQHQQQPLYVSEAGREQPEEQPAETNSTTGHGGACTCCCCPTPAPAVPLHPDSLNTTPASPAAASSVQAAAAAAAVGEAMEPVQAAAAAAAEPGAEAASHAAASAICTVTAAAAPATPPLPHPPAADAAAAGDPADSAAAAAAFEGLDPVVVSKLQKAEQLLQQLHQQCASAASTGITTNHHQEQQQQQEELYRTALTTLADILRNLASSPSEVRFKRLRCSNAAFHSRLGRFPAGLQLLQLAGFAEQQQVAAGSGGREAVLVYSRDDPGLLWLVLSLVQGALAEA